MDWRSDGSWEALAFDLDLDSAENQPLPRPVFSDGPRIAPKYQLNRSIATPKQPTAIRRVPISGDALERPLQQPSRSSGSFHSVADLQPSALSKREFTNTAIQSLMLPRELPELRGPSSNSCQTFQRCQESACSTIETATNIACGEPSGHHTDSAL